MDTAVPPDLSGSPMGVIDGQEGSGNRAVIEKVLDLGHGGLESNGDLVKQGGSKVIGGDLEKQVRSETTETRFKYRIKGLQKVLRG